MPANYYEKIKVKVFKQLNFWSPGEPDAGELARPVRERVVGKAGHLVSYTSRLF